LQALNRCALEGNRSFMSNPLTGPFLAYASKLRFPTLFKITLALFLFDLVLPDIVPFADEILLGLGTLILAGLQKSAERDERPPIDQEPPPRPPLPPQ